MKKIIIHQDKVVNPIDLIKICPFDAIQYTDDRLEINAGCKMCKICVKGHPEVFEMIEVETVNVDKTKWKGIAVYIDHVEGDIHPVSFELLGKARELAEKIDHPVHAVLIGSDITDRAEELLKYGVDEVFIYDHSELEAFRIEPYTSAFEDYINNNKPSIVLVGGTTIGRSLAPRVAARFKTGLTADCTVLDVQENTDLDQIRPAFGGNIMAHIYTPNHRPQFATVRYKIFDAPEIIDNPRGKITKCDLLEDRYKSNINVLDIKKKKSSKSIEDAEVLVVVGSAFKKEEDLNLAYELAKALGAEVASTRPLIEKGWMDAKLQIGLSGRTVRPKLIITCGVSGAIQFVAGMNGSENIMAINTDKSAPIFKVAHYAIVGDVYDVIPKLLNKIKDDCKSMEFEEVMSC